MDPETVSSGKSPEPAPMECCGRREQRDIEYRTRITSAARELFEMYGIESVTMFQVAQAAGVGQGTLYRRYEHMGEICSDLLKTTTSQFLEGLDSMVSVSDDHTPALSLLEDVVRRIVYLIDDKAPLLTAVNKKFAGQKNKTMHKHAVYQRILGIISLLFTRAVERRELKDCDVAVASGALMASLLPEQYLYYREELGYTKERYTQSIIRLFIGKHAHDAE